MDRAKLRWLVFALLPILLTTLGLAIWQNRSGSDNTAPEKQASIRTLNEPIIELTPVVSGLKSPTAIAPADIPGDKRLFIVEQAGTIRVLSEANTLGEAPLLDISPRVLSGGEMGLLGLVFHPKYEENGYFYINYTDKQQNTVIARFQVPKGQSQADPNSQKVLIKFKQPYVNHNGGDLQFGPDGLLYIALGDGGSAGDPQNYAQSKNTFLGKILRIDVDAGDPYAVPASNPFVNEAGARPEVWAWGLRNPWRISFDKTTGELYIADVGQNNSEEINLQKAGSRGGENWGWRCFEGSLEFNPEGCQSKDKYASPILEYENEGQRCSITGGYVYRGRANPALTGKYFYGDLCSGEVFYAQASGGKWQQTLAVKSVYSISSFGQDNDGELYLADYSGGGIYKIRDSAN